MSVVASVEGAREVGRLHLGGSPLGVDSLALGARGGKDIAHGAFLLRRLGVDVVFAVGGGGLRVDSLLELTVERDVVHSARVLAILARPGAVLGARVGGALGIVGLLTGENFPEVVDRELGFLGFASARGSHHELGEGDGARARIRIARRLGVFPLDDFDAATRLLGALSRGGAEVDDGVALVGELGLGVDLADGDAVVGDGRHCLLSLKLHLFVIFSDQISRGTLLRRSRILRVVLGAVGALDLVPPLSIDGRCWG